MIRESKLVLDEAGMAADPAHNGNLRTVQCFCVAALLCCCASAFAKTDPIFQSAKVISQSIGSYNAGAAAMPIGTMVVGVPIVRTSDIVVIETSTQRMTWSEFIKGRQGAVILPVNGVIQFYQDGKWFVVLDANKKKHKFSLVHLEAVDTPR